MSSQDKAETIITLMLEMINSKEEGEILADTFVRRIMALGPWDKFKVLGFFKTLGGKIVGTKL